MRRSLNFPPETSRWFSMSQQDELPESAHSEKGDGYADAFAVIAIIAIVITTYVFWLRSL
jgi:hypothetical protein